MSYMKFVKRPTQSPKKNSRLEKKLREFRKNRRALIGIGEADFFRSRLLQSASPIPMVG